MGKKITVEEFESGKVKLTDEVFRPVFIDVTWYGIPYKAVIAYHGIETGTLLSGDFSDILE